MALKSKSIAKILPLRRWSVKIPAALFVFVSLAIFMGSVTKTSTLSGVRTGIVDLVSPVVMAVHAPVQYAADYVRAISGLGELQAENDRLRLENNRLRDWYQKAAFLEEQNKSLKSLMNVQTEPHHTYVTGRIIADSGNTYVRSLLVMAGTDHGVRKGQAALSGDGIMGRVTEVGGKTSRILLLTDVNSRIPVLVQGDDFKAILAGDNTDFPVFQHMPAGASLKEGGRVITSGHGGVFPYGLPVGEVVLKEDGTPRVRLYANAMQGSHVRIVNSTLDPNLITP